MTRSESKNLSKIEPKNTSAVDERGLSETGRWRCLNCGQQVFVVVFSKLPEICQYCNDITTWVFFSASRGSAVRTINGGSRPFYQPQKRFVIDHVYGARAL